METVLAFLIGCYLSGAIVGGVVVILLAVGLIGTYILDVVKRFRK